MPFQSSVALEVRRKCHFQCCLCKSIGVEIHHIVPQAEGGSDLPENAAPLCPTCHETYGANRIKRKFIREARDFWYEVCAKRYASDASALHAIESAIARVATKEDVHDLRAQVADALTAFKAPPHTISIPVVKARPGAKRRLDIGDLLILVHATSMERSAMQIEMLCIRDLWPVGKDDWRGIYKTFITRFGELSLRHLAARALTLEQVPSADTIDEEPLLSALTRMRIEAMCMVLVDAELMGAVLSDTGEVLWTGLPPKLNPNPEP